MTYDSRYTNPALNRDAYEAFSKEDKDSIAGYFWEVNNKRRQFGTDGAEAVSAHAKNNEEMKKIAENYLKIIEAKMGYLTTDGTTLYSKFGGVDNDENYYYDQTLSDLMVFDYGSDAQIILSDPTYLQTEQGKIFAQKYIDMEANMRAGKIYYDKLVKVRADMVQAALKGVLWDDFSFLVGTVSAPTSQFSSIVIDGFWLGADYLDYTTAFFADTLGVEYQGAVSELKTSFMNGMRSGSGEAAKIVKQTAKVADGYIASANNAYDRALQTHNQLKEEAPGVLAEIKSTLEAQRIEAERKAAEEAFAATRKKEEIMQELAETPADTAQYEYIKELPPRSKEYCYTRR